MDAEQCQVAADLWTKLTDLSHKLAYSRRQETTSTNAIYYYSARKPTLIPRSVEG